MKLSVILPCYNGAATVALQLDALTRQRWQPDDELLVVNNGSTDTSMTIVESYRSRLPLRIVEAHQPPAPRRPVTHSYAVGFAAARGDAFLTCEADDVVGDDWLRALGQALEQHAFVAAALEYTRLNPPARQPRGWAQQSREAGLTTRSWPLYLPYASGCSFGLRRGVYEQLGDPDERCGASWDTDYCWRAALSGIELVFVPDALIHYRLRDSLEGAYRQGKGWGGGHVALQLKYHPYATRWAVSKHQLRNLRAMLRHLAEGRKIAVGEKTFESWLWGLGWNVAMLEGGALNWRVATGAASVPHFEKPPAGLAPVL